MICGNCGQPTAYISRSSRAFGKDGNLLVIENMPIITCRECGAEFISGLTSEQIDRWYSQYPELPTRPVPVVTFQDEEDPALAELTETAPPLRW